LTGDGFVVVAADCFSSSDGAWFVDEVVGADQRSTPVGMCFAREITTALVTPLSERRTIRAT